MSVPKVSVIIISYNMAREIPRTVHSFLPPYQTGLSLDDVEIIVMENGSSQPVPASIVANWPDNVSYVSVENPAPSPARALNEAFERAKGQFICPVIDGARMASPGLLKWCLQAIDSQPRSFAGTLGFHLGSKLQQLAVKEGYCQSVEDELLASINWPENGYDLFSIAALAGSSRRAWFSYQNESNAPVLPRSLYRELDGFDESFVIPGGGLVNLDFFNRLLALPDTNYFSVVGEGTFHQFHGGVTTSKRVTEIEQDGTSAWEKYTLEYKSIRGTAYRPMMRKPILYGQFPDQAVLPSLQGLKNIVEDQQK